MAESWPGYKTDERAIDAYLEGSALAHVTVGPVTHYFRVPFVDSFDSAHHTLKKDGLDDFSIVAHGSPKLPLTRVIERRVRSWRIISAIRRNIYREKGEVCVYEKDWPKKKVP